MKHAGSREEFIDLMEFEGYKVKWTDTRKNITYTTPDGKRCRDDRLHESKYLKERMELELRIRQEIVFGRTETAEQTTATGRTNAQSLSSDTGKTGQSILQSEPYMGWDRGTTKSVERNRTAKSQLENTDEQSTDTVGTGENQQEPIPNPADLVTGWEEERAYFFSAQAEITENRMVGFNMGVDEFATLGSNIISLGRSVECLSQPVPIRDRTTKPVVKEHKKGVGQKQDDHSGYDFEMKM
jgi:hypothetical protein